MPAMLLIKPWNDPIVDTLGHDPRSRYVETFWLPTLGPPNVSVQPIAGVDAYPAFDRHDNLEAARVARWGTSASQS